MKRSRRCMRLGLGLVVALALMAPAAMSGDLDAQVRPGRMGQGPRDGRRDDMQRQIQRRFNAEIRERLGFDDAQMEALMGVMREHGQRRRELAQRRQQARMKVRILGREELGGVALSNESAAEVLAELVEISQQEADLFGAEQAALLESFSPVQVFQLQQAREELAQRIRTMRGQGRGARGGPGAPGGLRYPVPEWFR